MPRSCGFRDHLAELAVFGARVAGVSSQPLAEQEAFPPRTRMPFPLISDEQFVLAAIVFLATFEFDGWTGRPALTALRRHGMVATGQRGGFVDAQASDRHRGATTGLSPTAKAFGASVSIPMEGQSLFFLVGRGEPPDAIVQATGGVVVTRLPDPRRVLAVLPLAAYAGLREHPGLELAGPVTIDPGRFGRFTQLVGLDDARPP
jgi:hypothetical protein